MLVEQPAYYIVPANEPDRVEELADGSLKFLHRSCEWKVARPGSWTRSASTGGHKIRWYEYLNAKPI
jgi:hypothetical protein